MSTESLRLPRVLSAGVLLLVAGGALALERLEVSSDLAFFLPDGVDGTMVEVTRTMAAGEAARTRTLLLRARDAASTTAAAHALATSLRRRPDVAEVREGPPARIEEAVRGIYWRRRAYLLPSGQRLDEATLRAYARTMRRRLAQPTGLATSGLMRKDPLGLLPSLAERLGAGTAGTLELIEGRFVTRDGAAVLFVVTRSSGLDGSAQAPLDAAIEQGVARLRGRHPGLRLEQAGVHRFAVASERAMRSDVSRVSIVSTIGIVLLFLALFRSPRALLLTLVATAAGFAVALLVALVAWGKVHGVTLAFGSALIGVCVDYPVHLACHHVLAERQSPWVSLRRVFPGLALGCGTTVASLAGLAWTSMPGLREVAIFSSVGVAAAFAATCVIVPPWIGTPARPPAAARYVAVGLARCLEVMRRRRVIPLSLSAVALVLAAVGLPRLAWNDDPAALSGVDSALTREDASVRARVTGLDTGRFVIATGRDDAEALERSARVEHALERARAAGEVRSWLSLPQVLPSLSDQRASVAALTDPSLPARADAAFALEGFRPGAVAPLFATYAVHVDPPLRYDEVAHSALGERVRPLRVPLGRGVAIVTLLGGVRAPDALAARVERIGGVRFFDRHAFVERALAAWRARTVQLLGAGLVVVLLVVLAFYRRVRAALAAFLPSVLAAATTLGVLGLLGVAGNLMALLGLVLVLSMGVDYGIFVVQHRDAPEEIPATLLGVVLACVTTVLSFGLLALSSSPALNALGLSVGLGVLFSLLLAPAVLVLLEPGARAAVPAPAGEAPP